MTDLGTRGATSAFILDMSRNGLVLVGNTGGAVWVDDSATGAVRDVPATASVINAAGTTAGVRASGKKDITGRCDDLEIFVHHPDGSLEVLGNPVGGDYGQLDCRSLGARRVSALDDDGTVVAQWVSSREGTVAVDIYVWAAKRWQKLPSLGGAMQAAYGAAGGMIAGSSATAPQGVASQDQHAVIWRDGEVIDLGDAGGCCDAARAINTKGQVVGQHTVNAVTHAFSWEAGRRTDLGSLPAFESSVANAINRDGTIVGTASYYSWEGLGAYRAVLFTAGKVYDLNDLVDHHDFLLTGAARIADNGAIAVNTGPVLSRALVLVPTGAPPVADRSWRGRGQVLASDENASGLYVDATDLYWITVSTDRQVSIKSVPKSGGAVRTLWHTDRGFSYGNLVGDDSQLWFDLATCSSVVCEGDTAIWSMPKSGGTAKRFSDGGRFLALGSSLLFATRSNGTAEDLIATPKTGGTSSVHVQATELVGITVDGDVAYFLKYAQLGSFHRFVLSRDSAGSVTDLAVAPIDFDGGSLALDETSIFVRGVTLNQLSRFPRAGGAPETLARVESTRGYRNEIRSDGRFLYWTQLWGNGTAACVARVEKQGGTPSCLDSGYWRYASVRVDESSVYFIRDTEIVRIPK